MDSFLSDLNLDMAGVVEKTRQSLVRINFGSGNGAGTIWHADGLIITNAHVVGGLERQVLYRRRRGGLRAYQPDLSVTLPDGTKVPGKILAMDAERDIAAISVEASGLPTVALGHSTALKAGEWVVAVGHPWGVPGAASAGVVIGRGAELPEITRGKDWIVVNLKVRPGNSGGPLVNAVGQLIGINTLLTGPQIGAAVPVESIKSFLKESLGARVTETIV
jgi:S1-C subfamily serine protease